MPRPGHILHITFLELVHEIISTAILLLAQIQEGYLSLLHFCTG